MLFSKKLRIEFSHCAFTFQCQSIAPLYQKGNTIHVNSCFSALLLIAFSSNYTMYSKPLYNLFLIFFLAAVPFIYFDRAFMILCAHRAQLCSKIHLFATFPCFCAIICFACACLWRGLAAGWAPCGRDGRFAAHGSRFFAARWVHRAPANRFAVFAAAGVCVVDCTPTNGTPFSLYNGVRVCCRYAIRFFVPLALPLIPGSPLPISICASS